MPELGFFLAAQDVSLDQHTNRVSIWNVFDEIPVREREEGEILPGLALVCLLYVTEEEIGDEFDFTYSLRLPGMEEEEQFTEFEIQPTQRRHRVVSRLQGLSLTQGGELTFYAHLDGEQIGTYVINLEGVQQEYEPENLADEAGNS